VIDERRRGTYFGTAAYLMWGLFPLYWPLLEPAVPIEILAHRVVWSLVVCAALLVVVPAARAVFSLGWRRLRLLAVAACALALNWGVFIYGVNSHQVVETSLGYFINPIVTVSLAVLVLGETLRARQWVAVGVASLAVIVLTVDYGRPPLIAITLAFTFAGYGLMKKKAGVGAIESLAVETAVLFLPALGVLAVIAARGQAHVEGVSHGLLLAGAGAVTALPLLAFGAAARRVPLTTLGLLQYLAPTLQFLIGVVVRGEPMPAVRLVGFGLVWIALALFTGEALSHRRRQLRLTTEASAA
jgi:chloramphenicol-sensitive protein RarD